MPWSLNDEIRELEDENFRMENATNHVIRRPVGVGALITPWNLPLYLLSWKVAPAIGMGNTVICKPSELTPMTANLMMEVIKDSGLPDGVVNLIHGTGVEAGAPLVSHPDVRFVSFTGGTSTGSIVARDAAASFKKISLELGGKNATIILDDCDLEEHMGSIVRASFLNQGQVCLCGSRILIQDSIYESFKNKFVEAVNQAKNPPFDSWEKAELIKLADNDKARVLSNGKISISRETGITFQERTNILKEIRSIEGSLQYRAEVDPTQTIQVGDNAPQNLQQMIISDSEVAKTRDRLLYLEKQLRYIEDGGVVNYSGELTG